MITRGRIERMEARFMRMIDALADELDPVKRGEQLSKIRTQFYREMESIRADLERGKR